MLRQTIRPFQGKGRFVTAMLTLLAGYVHVHGHDTFLRPVDFAPDGPGELEILVFNGTYNESVDSIPWNLVGEVRTRHPSGREQVQEEGWIRGEAGSRAWQGIQLLQGTLGGIDNRRTSTLWVNLSEEGTSLVGITLHELRTAMDPARFSSYLHESGLENSGLADFLNGDPDQLIRERYVKACKTVVTTGNAGRGDPTRPLGQVVEIIPLTHPAQARPGEPMDFLALLNGQPVGQQVVLAGHRESFFNRGAEDRIILTTAADGTFSMIPDRDGEWWLKFNHIVPADPEDNVNFITHWATLTFNIP